MELQTQQTQDLALQIQVPTTAIVGKEAIAKYLPNDLQMSLKQMAKAQISQSMLKYASDSEISQFAIRLINFINPKFEEGEAEIAEAEIYSFAKNCELTANEFLLALEMSADGKLYSEPDTNGNSEKIKLYREVDRLKLGEVKSAYIALKRADKVFQEDVKKIKAFLEPPKPEPTEEELKEQRLKFYSEEYKRLQIDGNVLGTTIFYDLIKKEGLETVKLKWLEVILDKFKPETVDKSLINEPQLVKIPKIKKHDAKTFFIDELVHAYFLNKKLKELSEEEFIKHWENIFL